MKPKSSTASKAATLTEPFEDDKQGLVANEDGGPKVLTQRECDSFDKKLHPFDSDSGLRRLRARRPKRASSFVALCLYFSFFCLGLFTALFITSFQTDFLRWYFSCVHLKVESNEGFTPQAVPQGHLMDFIAAAPPASSAACPDSCTFSIVESIPQNLTYGHDEFIHTSTYTGLKTLLASAKHSVRIASFYWTLRGADIAFHDRSASEGEDIFNSLLQLSKTGGVSLQIAQNAANNDTALLAERSHAEVRTLNFTRLVGSGILHTKFWLVDEQHFYIGSANLDWRSLTQVKELGVLVQNCPSLGKDLQKIFDVYWYLGQANATVPSSWPAQYDTSINAHSPLTVHFNNTQAPVYMSSSPPLFCPAGRTTDIDAITDVIHQAKHFVYIAVMDYSPATLYLNPNRYWPVIDDALRSAAFDRQVTVRLLASRWAHTMKDMYAFLCSLSMLNNLHYPRTHIEVKLFEVPSFSKNQSEIPFARVNHNKYMVTDQHAYIGTSNWSGDYFISTGGVGFIVKQPQSSMNTTNGNLRQQLHDVFIRDWYSNYTYDLYCTFNSTRAFKLDE